MLKKMLFVLPACLFLASCATPTPYQPEDRSGGYTDMALNKNTYTVTFRGNSLTSEQVVNSYLLRRGAELTLNNGYNYFIKLDSDTVKNTEVVTTPTTINTYNTNTKEGKEKHTVVSSGGSYNVDTYTAKMTIRMFADNKKHRHAFDAATILRNFPTPQEKQH